jgi:hypothetical protein
VEGVVSRARLLGKRRAVLVCGSGEGGLSLCFARVSADSWEWLGDPVALAGFEARRLAAKPCCVEFCGARGEEWRGRLAEGEPCGCRDCAVADCGEEEVSFCLGGKPAGARLVLA